MPTPGQTTAGNRLLALARTALGTLEPGEELLIAGAATEQGVDLGKSTGELPWISKSDNVDADPARWGPERNVRAEVIRWLCVDKGAAALVDPLGIRLRGARILGKLDVGLASIPFPLEITYCRLAEGARLVGCQIGRLVLEGCWTGPIAADGADVKQSVFLSHGFRCDGTLSLVMAQIGASLVCEGASFFAPNDEEKMAFSGDGISVGGDLLLRADRDSAGKTRQFRAEGKVSLIGAKIGGDLDCTDGAFLNAGGEAIVLQRAVIGGALSFFSDAKAHAKGRFKSEGKIDLEFASAKVFASPETCWPKPGDLALNGFSYTGLDGLKDAQTQLRWLQLDTTQPPPPQPYRQLAKILLDSGDAEGAKLVLQEKERTLTPPWIKPLKAPIGYGYKPGNAVWGLLLLTFLGTLLYWCNAGNMVPTAAAGGPVYYAPFQPLAYSFENTFPLVKIGQTDKWQPKPDAPGPAHYLRWFVWAQTIMGWVLATLFVAAVSGIVQHSD